MSAELLGWLARRSPPAVFDLAPWLDGLPAGSPPARALSAAGGRALDRALTRPGRVRASAMHLLAADALITYACEAALETEDPKAELADVLRSVSDR